MNAQKRRAIFERLREAEPKPTTELRYSSPFELLVAVLLSAQMTDRGVNKATEALFAAADNPAAMLALGEDALKVHLKTINFYNTKAKNLLKTCQMLVEQHGGQVPASREALEKLPGVGRKTANVILNTAFAHPVMAVDTHIYRVANRTRLATGQTVREVEDKLTRLVPKEFLQDAHHWLILHGRYVCVARKPRCAACVIYDLCEFEHKTA